MNGATIAGQRRHRGLINTYRWQQLRGAFIAEARRVAVANGDTIRCAQTGEPLTGVEPAPNSPVVDHKIRHGNDPVLFYDWNNLQLVSKAWHDKVKQSREKGGMK